MASIHMHPIKQKLKAVHFSGCHIAERHGQLTTTGWALWKEEGRNYKQKHDWCNEGRGMCYPVCGMVGF